MADNKPTLPPDRSPLDCPLTLAREQLDAIKAALPKGFRHYSDQLITATEWLRGGWNGELGGCRKTTWERIQAVRQAVEIKGYSVLDLGWAIRAYGAECRGDAWRSKHPMARMSLERFLGSDRLDYYLDQGDKLRAADRRTTRRARDQAAAIEDHWRSMTDEQRMDWMTRACSRLKQAGRPYAFSHPDTIAYTKKLAYEVEGQK